MAVEAQIFTAVADQKGAYTHLCRNMAPNCCQQKNGGCDVLRAWRGRSRIVRRCKSPNEVVNETKEMRLCATAAVYEIVQNGRDTMQVSKLSRKLGSSSHIRDGRSLNCTRESSVNLEQTRTLRFDALHF